MAQKTDDSIIAQIEAVIKANGAQEVTGALLQQVLKLMVDKTPNYSMPCDPAMDSGDVGKTLMLASDGLIKVYAEEDEQEAEYFKVQVEFTGVTENHDGVNAFSAWTFGDVPGEGQTLRIVTGVEDETYTFTAVDNIGNNVQIIGGDLPGTMANLLGKIAYMDATAEFNVDTLTLKSIAVGTVPNGVWYLKFDASPENYFNGGIGTSTPVITLIDTYGEETEIDAKDWWPDYSVPPADVIEEAGAFADHIGLSIAGWTASHVAGTGRVELTTDVYPDVISSYAVTKNEMPDVTITTLEVGQAYIPQRSKNPFVGFCGGVEEVEGTNYAIIRTGALQPGTLIANQPIDIAEYDLILTGGGTPSGLLIACNGGKLRKFRGIYDTLAIVGFAMHSMTDEPTEQKMIVKEVFLPLFG